MSYETHQDAAGTAGENGLPVTDIPVGTGLIEAVCTETGKVQDAGTGSREGNVFRRSIKEDPNRIRYARHRLWMESLQHEYPMPYVKYRVGIYIRFFNQTKYSDEVYLEKHKAKFREDVACCPLWELVDFYVDQGSAAPGMEYSKEWLRLLDDCFVGKVNLIVTQKVSNVSNDPSEVGFVARILANQGTPVGIYFISEDIFTLGSYYRADLKDEGFVPPGWKTLPPDDLDWPLPLGHRELPAAAGGPADGEAG